MAVALLISLMLGFGLSTTALGATDFDGDGVGDGDCQPYNPLVAPGKPDIPNLQFEDTNCDGIDGDESKAVFVALSGDDNATGTKANPVRTITKGITLAAPAGKDVYIAGGTYGSSSDTTHLADNVGLYGGYVPLTGARSASEPTTIWGGPQAVLADGDEGGVLQQLALAGKRQLASTNPPSGPPPPIDTSVYSVRAINGSKLALERVSVIAENGKDGSTGFTGSTPQKAANGLAGDDRNDCTTPGVQVPNGGGGTFDPNRGGRSGAGGEETDFGHNGDRGEQACLARSSTEGPGESPVWPSPSPSTGKLAGLAQIAHWGPTAATPSFRSLAGVQCGLPSQASRAPRRARPRRRRFFRRLPLALYARSGCLDDNPGR